MRPHAGAPSEALRRKLVAEGFGQVMVWHKAFPPDLDDGGCCDPVGEGPKSAAARQRERVKRDKESGKVRFSVKTADDEESRGLVAAVAKTFIEGRATGSPRFHKTIHAALHNPDIALVGAKVLALRGLRRMIVMYLIGELL